MASRDGGRWAAAAGSGGYAAAQGYHAHVGGEGVEDTPYQPHAAGQQDEGEGEALASYYRARAYVPPELRTDAAAAPESAPQQPHDAGARTSRANSVCRAHGLPFLLAPLNGLLPCSPRGRPRLRRLRRGTASHAPRGAVPGRRFPRRGESAAKEPGALRWRSPRALMVPCSRGRWNKEKNNQCVLDRAIDPSLYPFPVQMEAWKHADTGLLEARPQSFSAHR